MTQAQSYRDEARQAAMRGDNELAVDLYEKALISAVKVFKEEDLEVVMRRAELGEAYRAVGRWKDAIKHLDYAWKRARYDAETRNLWLDQEGDMAMNCGEKLARACQADSKYADAVMVFRTAIADNEKAKRPQDEALHLYALLADNFLLLKQEAEAAQAIESAVKVADEMNAQNPRALSRALSQLGNIYFSHDRTALAKPLYQRSVILAAQHLPPSDEDRVMIQARLASILLKDGKLDESALLLDDSIQNLLRTNTPDSAKMVPLHLSLSELDTQRGQHENALKHAVEALRISRLHFVEAHPDIVKSLMRLGICQVNLKDTDKGEATLKQAYELSRSVFGKDNPQTQAAKALYDKVGE